jgi:hypothetical protein
MKRRRKQEKIDPEAGWTIGWYRRRFRELAMQPAFHGVMTLARVANMLRFVYSVIVKTKGEGPGARRQRTNAFYLSGALLVETEKTIEGVGRIFKGAPDFVELSKTVHSPDFDKIVSRFRTLRKQAAFHFDLEAFAPAIQKLVKEDRPFYAFMTAYGSANKDCYFDLADDVPMQLILEEDRFGEWMRDWMSLSANVTNDVFHALDTFISHRLHEWGVDKQPTTEAAPDDIQETRGIMNERRGAKESKTAP